MGKITNEMIWKSFSIGKKVYKKEIQLKTGVEKLKQMGMNHSSAHDYIYSYSNLIQGKLFTRTTSAYATDYYLEKIFQENGVNGIKSALLSLSQHFDYYEDKTGSAVIKRRKIYEKYLKLIPDNTSEIIYPDEVDQNEEYSEGKAKQVLVNSYERNDIARLKCIEHYGLQCQVCNINFEERYGTIGKDFIHVHHKIEIASIGHEYSINPIKDLIPVCPNCHSMLHKRKPAYSIEELKEIIK